jgi:tRNA(adenine34) deaminase
MSLFDGFPPTVSRIHYDMSSGELEVAHGRRIPASDLQISLMNIALREARDALEEGNPPIGAVLFSPDLGISWPDHTTDKKSGFILDHAETKAYSGSARLILGSNLAGCMLVSTLELCPMCTAVYTQGKIGSITVAASRNDVNGLRRREIGMHELIKDGKIDTTVYRGLFKDESVALFKEYLGEFGGANEHGRLFDNTKSARVSYIGEQI